MNAYLSHLGIRPEIQDWLAPYYFTNSAGHLCFDYGDDTETFALAFHRVPSQGSWLAGNNDNLMRQVVICSSAMEAIAWLNNHPVNPGHLLIVAIGSSTGLVRLPSSKYTLVFGDDLLGHCLDLKVAARLAGHLLSISVVADLVLIDFRFRHYCLPVETFSLNAFARISGYRFNNIKTSKPARHSSWLNQLLAYGND